MSCPDWRSLVAHRFAPDGREAADWPAARAHLEECPACRRRALALDPTLVFAGLNRLQERAQPPSLDTDEIRRSLRTMRRTQALAARHSRLTLPGRVAAALVLALAALLLGGVPTGGPASEPAGAGFGYPWLPQSEVASPPFVEAVGRPEARIYQLGQEDFSLVMIVDENLDV